MTQPLVIEVARSGFVESRHLVDVAVVDRDGALVASAGDPSTAAAFRSSAKPIQARVALDAGWMPYSDEHLALACASHNGEPRHVDNVRAMLAAADVGEDALLTPLDVPAYPPAALGVTERRRIYHNCSGKHASMLATCAAAGWPLQDYRAPDHPLQQRITALIADMTGTEPRLLVDGCGVPTTVAPLQAIARAFLAIDDGGPETIAMRAYPFMVGGSERLDTDLMAAAPSVLIKSGAEGLACVSVGGLGVALKSRDGFASRFRGPAVIHVLDELGVAEVALPEHRAVPVLGGGQPVGSVRATGTLTRA
jgi:L-asparaginase II